MASSTPDERSKYYSEVALPDSLSELSQRHESFNQVVQYLEGCYLSAVHKGIDRGAVEEESRTFMVEALVSVAADIDTIAANLERYIHLQADAVDAVTNQVAIAQS